MKWKPGYTPKEHLEMLQLEELRDQQRRDAETNRQFQKSQADDQRRHQWRTLAVAICGVLVAAWSATKSKEPQAPPAVNIVISPNDGTTPAAVRVIDATPAKPAALPSQGDH